jgi:hypothetical protein
LSATPNSNEAKALFRRFNADIESPLIPESPGPPQDIITRERLVKALIEYNPHLKKLPRISGLGNIMIELLPHLPAEIPIHLLVGDDCAFITDPGWAGPRDADERGLYQALAYLRVARNIAGFFAFDPQTGRAFDPAQCDFTDAWVYSASQTLQVTYTLTRGDFFEGLFAMRHHKWWIRWPFRATTTIFVLWSVFAIDASNLRAWFVFTCAWLFLFWGWPWLAARAEYLNEPSAKQHRTANFSRYGTKLCWTDGSSEKEWSKYNAWLESANELMLCTSSSQYDIIPKRATNAQQLSELRALFRRRIGAGARVWTVRDYLK